MGLIHGTLEKFVALDVLRFGIPVFDIFFVGSHRGQEPMMMMRTYPISEQSSNAIATSLFYSMIAINYAESCRTNFGQNDRHREIN